MEVSLYREEEERINKQGEAASEPTHVKAKQRKE